MYNTHKKSVVNADDKTISGDCFIEKTRKWLLAIIIFVSVSIVYAIAASVQGSGDSITVRAVQSVPQGGQFQTAALGGIPARHVLIKELALEVSASQGKGSVIIQTVYAGGNAEKAGLKAGDSIVQFNGHNIKNIKQFESTVALAKPEVDVEIRVIRNNKKLKLVVFVGEGEMEGATVPIK